MERAIPTTCSGGSDIEPPLVSIIVPAYNQASRLAVCLEALGNQSYRHDRYEIVVVDNGSDEPLRAVVAAWPRARYLFHPEPGAYSARNAGIRAAGGDVLAFTDSDCVPHPGWLESGVARLCAAPSSVVGGRVEVVARARHKPSAIELYDRFTSLDNARYVAQEGFSVTANLFVRKDVLMQVGLFDASLLSSGDKEWGRRARSAGHPIVYAADAIVEHPARHRLSALINKRRRLLGGRCRNASDRPGVDRRHLLLTAAGSLRPPIRYLRALRDRTDLPSLDKLRIFAVEMAMRCVDLYEALRLSVGGRPVR